MIKGKNEIKNIDNSQIKEINQTYIEKQENFYIVNDSEFSKVKISHKLFPDFEVGTSLKEDGTYQLISNPTNENSYKKYPKNYKVSFEVVDERFKNVKDKKELWEMIQYADSPVEIEFTRFEQFLGTIKDPYPDENLSPMKEGIKSYFYPQKRELPKVKLNIDMVFKDTKYKISNLNLKLTKQLSNRRYIFDNYYQQNKLVHIQLDLKFEDSGMITGKINYKANINMLTNSKEMLKYHTFVMNMLTKKCYLYDRKSQVNFISVKTPNEKNSKIKSLNNYIDIIKKLCCIEKYFGIEFSKYDKISNSDIAEINELYGYIMNEKTYKKYYKANNITFTFKKKNIDINIIKGINLPKTSIMKIGESLIFNILDKEIKVSKIIEKYIDIKCSNVDEINEIINDKKFSDEYVAKIIFSPKRGKYLKIETKIIK